MVGYLMFIFMMIMTGIKTDSINNDSSGEKEQYFVKDENFTLRCNVTYPISTIVELNWKYPGNNSDGRIQFETKEEVLNVSSSVKYSYITVYNGSAEDDGRYTCMSNKTSELKEEISYIQKFAYISFTFNEDSCDEGVRYQEIQLVNTKRIDFKAYPSVNNYSIFKNNIELSNSEIGKEKKYQINLYETYIIFHINDVNVYDTANYTVVLRNGPCSESTAYQFCPIVDPEVKLEGGNEKKVQINSTLSLTCVATGNPFPSIEWRHGSAVKNGYESFEKVSHFGLKSTINLTFPTSENVTCVAFNKWARHSTTVRMLVYEVENGFKIKDNTTWYPEYSDVTKECIASKYDYTEPYWLGINGEHLVDETVVENYKTDFSYITKLHLRNITLNQAGEYSCIGFKIKPNANYALKIQIDVAATVLPHVIATGEKQIEKYYYQQAEFSCCVEAVPPPLIEWYKISPNNTQLLSNSTIFNIAYTPINRTSNCSKIHITPEKESEEGIYACKGISGDKNVTENFSLSIKVNHTVMIVAAVMIIIIVILLIIVGRLYWKNLKYEEKFRKGEPDKLDSTIDISAQAGRLPYEERFEFPKKDLKILEQLGAGSFGVVLKAKATNIRASESVTIVAVKTFKKSLNILDNKTNLDALAAELKILQHIGEHPNVVCLLGACTKNLIKGELLVIVEYCDSGNLRDYLELRRRVFVDHFNPRTTPNYYGPTHSGLKDSSGNRTTELGCSCDSLSSDNVGEGTITNGYVCHKTVARNVCTQDLCIWALQIARGMEHLAKRKVLHGDLALRNVLLATGNSVKICDFGLSKKIEDKRVNRLDKSVPMPIRWHAIECLLDYVYSTQSDVWSFGVVLWELFSLAMWPYPYCDRKESIIEFLKRGKRMECPPYANEYLHKMMLRCWHKKPNERPSFTKLLEELLPLLNNKNRQLNEDMNIRITYNVEGTRDFVDKICSPDFDNMLTNNSHTYVTAKPVSGTQDKLKMKCFEQLKRRQ